jgi:hypothetical protein
MIMCIYVNIHIYVDMYINSYMWTNVLVQIIYFFNMFVYIQAEVHKNLYIHKYT